MSIIKSNHSSEHPPSPLQTNRFEPVFQLLDRKAK